MSNDINLQLKDSLINSETKTNIVNTFIKTNNNVLMGIFGLTVIGTLVYTSEKNVQHGGGFNPLNFWFN